MFPLFPFAAGLLTGAVAIKLIRSEKAKKQLDKAQDRLREATVSRLSTIEQSTAKLRDKLQGSPASEPAATAQKAAVKPVRKPATKRKAPAKPKAGEAKTGADA